MSEPHPSAVEIAWDRGGSEGACEPAYFVGGAPVGSGAAGFDRVIDLVTASPAARIVLRIKEISLGGSDIAGATPFADRFAELRKAAGNRPIMLRFD